MSWEVNKFNRIFRIQVILSKEFPILKVTESFILFTQQPVIIFYIFLSVHLRIILVSDQLDAQFLL